MGKKGVEITLNNLLLILFALFIMVVILFVATDIPEALGIETPSLLDVTVGGLKLAGEGIWKLGNLIITS